MDYNSPEEIKKYVKNYNEDDFFTKIMKYAKVIGYELLYKALQLYYVLQKPDTPAWVKAVIMGALGYFILPIDVVPDFIPGIGYTDDFAVLAFALTVAATYVDDEVNRKAKETLESIFG